MAMSRTALSVAVLFVTASALFYLFGIRTILLLGVLMCLIALFCYFWCKRKGNGFKAVAVFLLVAVFCTFLATLYSRKIENTESLSGTKQTVICRIVEEPIDKGTYTVFFVETDGTNGFDEGFWGPVRLRLNINNSLDVSKASEGDILSAELEFNRMDKSVRKGYWTDRIYVLSYCRSAEIIGHEESIYTRCIDLRKSIRKGIDEYADGDNGAVLKGLLLGDKDGMSPELHSDFKVCGVMHVTAVSGMHIGAFCMLVTGLLGLVMSRRKASIFAFIPLVVTVMLAGVTPSAVRAGIMCGLTLLADITFKKTESINSLGIAVAVMLVFNPFYILDLGFQLSCSASAGVILAAPYGHILAERLSKTKFRTVNQIIGATVRVFTASLGAVILTLPFQIIAFGFVSVIAPLASTLICAAAVYAMVTTIVSLIMHFTPYVEYIAIIPFWIADLLATYICTVVKLLAKIPFSYIPFGDNTAILCIGMALALVALWILLNRPGGKRLISLFVTVMIVASVLGNYVTSKDIVEVAVLETGDALCTVVSHRDKCIIIGCGDDSSDRYTLRTHLLNRGITEVEMLLIPSESEVCFGGYKHIIREVTPDKIVVPDNFGNSTVFSGGVTVATDNAEYTANDGKIGIRTVKCKYGCVYELSIYGKRFIIGNSNYTAENIGMGEVDCVITSRIFPKITSEILIISANSDIGIGRAQREIPVMDRTISVKLKPNKGMTVYAGQN